ncbi:MAG: 3'-5' exonuclease [Chlorobi bacterium]|nr:3'-5' exonuclease [Chlorobiota bacterium]
MTKQNFFDRPIAVFDLETTGIDTSKDRIVEISILRVETDGTETVYTRRVNPGMPIPAQATAVHGITDEDVKDAPRFEEIAAEVYALINDAYLAGFNSNRFDLPMLVEELLRAGLEVDLRRNKTIDVQVIYHKKEPRNLAAAYRFYTGKELDNAHSAEADVRATWEVLQSQLQRYDDLPKDAEKLSAFSSFNRNADFMGRVVYDNDGNEIVNFGKYKGKKVEEVLEKDPGYYGWIMQADFPAYTKLVFKNVYERMRLRQEKEKLQQLQDKFNRKP